MTKGVGVYYTQPVSTACGIFLLINPFFFFDLINEQQQDQSDCLTYD